MSQPTGDPAAVAPRILPLTEALSEPRAGGKARGLARLVALGLRVPPGFVIVGATPERMPERLAEAYAALGGGQVAVRSSAEDEDGSERSFAGQYETILDVSGLEALRGAVAACLRSAQAARVRAYRGERAAAAAGRAAARETDTETETDSGSERETVCLAVVVQRHVAARCAGVVFTADPVSGRRDRAVVDAVPGLGEDLVSGRVTPDHFLVDEEGRGCAEERRHEAGTLAPAELAAIARQARHAAARLGGPLDLEWAIDGAGALWWLQARPITGLPGDPQELDTRARAGDVYTRANFGEMMPGAVCPLTLSVTGWAIDQGIQQLLVDAGVRPGRRPGFVTLATFHGHLFFNLSPIFEFSRQVGGASPEAVMIAICGRVLPEVSRGQPAGALTRAWHGLGYLRYLVSGVLAVGPFERRLAGFGIPLREGPEASYAAIDAALPRLLEAYHVHLRCSALSGLTNALLHSLLASGGAPTAEHEAEVARLLSRVRGVESALLLSDVERVAAFVAAEPEAPGGFLGVGPEAALAWLRSPASGRAAEAFEAFLGRHGHRAVREIDLRQPGWRDDPLPLVTSLQASVAGRLAAETAAREVGVDPEAPTPLGAEAPPRPVAGWRAEPPLPRPLRNPAGRWLLELSRDAVRRREHTKGLLVRVTDVFKGAYRHLAAALVGAGRLPEPDLIGFLTHGELGRLARGPELGLVALAAGRRRIFPGQEALTFPDLSIGRPEPSSWAPGTEAPEGALQGRPVSPGVVEGPARVCRTAAEAAEVRPGEILVAPITDVGWTPVFGVIAGLATDVGSAISHGAVVAREYGLPAVVGLRTATRAFRTGDRVVLDGGRGTLRLAAPR